MDDALFFIQTPRITIATNTFLCRIPIRYKDSPVLEIVKEVTTHKTDTFTTKIPIFHPDGTKLAVVKGRQIYLTEDGKKAGVELRNLPDGTVCEINRRAAFEMRRNGAAALKMSAELHTFDGAFLRWTETEISGLLSFKPGGLALGTSLITGCGFQEGVEIRASEPGGLILGGCSFVNCEFQGEVGIQIGNPTIPPLGACVGLDFVKPDE